MINQKKIICPNCRNFFPVSYRYKVRNFYIFECQNCEIGFTFPTPKKIDKYYHENYWVSPGLIGIIRNWFFILFQKRRKKWVKDYLKSGTILDVGSGEGSFGKLLKEDFQVTSIDTQNAKLKNPEIIKVDFLKWRSKKKFDAIVFWESLEHIACPIKYLQIANKFLKPGGYIFVEYPRYDCLEAKIFGKNWFHLDPPRHLSHLTRKGLLHSTSSLPLKEVLHHSVLAGEYTLWGFIASLFGIFDKRPTDLYKNNQSSIYFYLLSPLTIFATLAQIIFYCMRQSPIGLMVFNKHPTKNLVPLKPHH